MNIRIKTTRLTEKDKNTILKNTNICTDSPGKGCLVDKHNGKNKKLN